MKRIFTFLMLLVAYNCTAQFSPKVDTLFFGDADTDRGNLFEVIMYSGDSIKINGIMYRFQATTGLWVTAGTGYIRPLNSADILKYPGIPYWNHSMTMQTDCPVWYKKSDNTLRGHIMVPETIGGTETATITCEDGGVYVYETEGSDFVAYIGPIDSIPVPFLVKNLGKNSTVTVQSIEGLYFDSTATTSLTLDYGDWVRFTPDSTRFITESNMNRATLEEYYKKIEADTVFVKNTEDSLYRYAAYEAGNNIIEVLATTKEVTASLANSNEFTFTIPAGTKVLSAKIRVENLSSVVCIIGTGDMANDSMKDRWMPTVAGWREDTGQQLMGMTTLMDLSNYSKFTINGLINTTKCQIRIGF